MCCLTAILHKNRIGVDADEGDVWAIMQICLNILARSAAHHPICDFASDIIMKNGQRIFGSARIGNGPDPVAAQIPGAECEIVSKTIMSEPLVGNRGVIAPQLGVNMPIFSEDGKLILNLYHKN